MPYQGFWGLCALALILMGHAVYCMVTTTKGKERQPLSKIKKVQLGALLGVCGLALGTGVVMQLLGADEAMVHVMGLAVLLSAFALSDRIRKYLPDMIKEENEETKDE